LTATLVKFLAPRDGHCETGVCVCRVCRTNMRLVGVEPHPLPNVGTDLFTYECVCGALHTDSICLQNLLGLAHLDIGEPQARRS
jgi:hypothetical protein